MIVIVFVFFFGSMSLAATVPEKSISLTAGIMQGYRDLLHLFKLDSILPVIGFLVAFGSIGSLIAWIGGPSKGLLASAKEGVLPPLMHKTNKYNIPINILWIQGIIVTILSFVFVLMPNVSSAFYMLIDLTIILYLTMYLMLYFSAIKLRYKAPNVERKYKIPGGNYGMWIVAGMGSLAVIFAIILGFFPPSELKAPCVSVLVAFS